MKKLRFIVGLMLVLIMMFSFPAAAFAVDVSTWDEFQTAFTTGSDTTITLKADITFANMLSAVTGRTIVINGQTYVLKNVQLGGEGTVTINGNVEGIDNGTGTSKDALTVSDEVTVNVKGNVTGGDNSLAGETAGKGVVASEKATVNVTGNISGGDNTAENGTGGTGIDTKGANNDATVNVTGNISGGDNTAENGTGGTGIAAEGTSEVSITGNVGGGDSTLTDKQIAEENKNADGGTAITEANEASVKVTGSVDGGDGVGHNADGGTGAEVMDKAQLEVGGSISGGDVTALPSESYTGPVAPTPAIEPGTGAGTGVYAAPEAKVEVKKDVTGGSSDAGNAGDGIILLTVAPVVANPGHVNVGGTVEGGISDNAKADDGAAIYIEITTGVNTLSAGNAATVTAWRVSDESGKMVEASKPAMLDEAKDYVAENTTYTVKVYQPKNGKLSVSPLSGVAGTKVTVKVTWDKDANLNNFKGIFYGGGKAKEISENTYEFYIPSGGGVQVYAAFNAPKTGDSSNLCLWLGLVLASSAALAYPMLRRKKEQ